MGGASSEQLLRLRKQSAGRAGWQETTPLPGSVLRRVTGRRKVPMGQVTAFSKVADERQARENVKVSGLVTLRKTICHNE